MGLQRGLIEFEVDATQLQRIEIKLKNMKHKAPQALKNAVNATAREAKKELAKKAQETYAVKAPRFKRAIAQKNATISKPTATLKITGKTEPLTDFSNKPHGGAMGARAKVLRGGSFKDMSAPSGLKAFTATFKSGHVAIVRRDPPNKYTDGLAERTGKGDITKITEFYGMSQPYMIGNEAKVYGVIKPNIQKNLQKHVQRQVDKILGGK